MYNVHIDLETYHLRSYLTDIFTVLSFEELEQVSGGLAIWDDGYGRWLYYREFTPYMSQGALKSYRDAWRYGFPAW